MFDECNDEILACTHLSLVAIIKVTSKRYHDLPFNKLPKCTSQTTSSMQNIRRKQAAQRKRIRQKKDETAARQSARTAEEQVQHELFGEDADAGSVSCFSVIL